jgi:uncharacterized protein
MWIAWLAADPAVPWHGVHAQDLQPVPALTARVIDLTGTLSADIQRKRSKTSWRQLEQSKGSQVVVLLVQPSA